MRATEPSSASVPAGQDADSERERRLAALPPHKRALLQRLRTARAAPVTARSPAPAVESLRRGDGDGILLIHPVGGEVLCYGEVVRRLPEGVTVHGIGADDTLRAPSPPDLESLVQHYVALVRAAGLRIGLLAGWSFGGIVAYEMARAFSESGRPCPVAVLDAIPAPPGQPPRHHPIAELREAFAFDLMRSSGRRPEDLRIDSTVWDLPLPESMAVLRSALAEQDIRPLLDAGELADRAQVHANAFTSLERFRPRPGGPPVHLLWATGSVTDPTPWWRPVSGEPVAATSVAADHYSLLRAPAVQTVAAFLHDALRHGAAQPSRPSLTQEDSR